MTANAPRLIMNRLIPLVALAALAALATGCKKDKGLSPAPPAGSAEPGSAASPPASPGSGPMAPATPPPTPAPAPTAGDHAATTPSGLPKECDDYKAAIDKLTACPKLAPAAKDSLVQAYQAASASWARLPADSKKNLGATCKAGADSVLAAGKTQCGW